MRVSHQAMVIIRFFIIDIMLEFYGLSNPETLAIMSSKKWGDYAKIYVFASSKKHGNVRQWQGRIAKPYKPENIDHQP